MRGRRASRYSPYLRSNSRNPFVTFLLYRFDAQCPEVASNMNAMGLVKVFVKIMVLLVVVAAIVGVVALVKKRDTEPVSFEHWPDIARKTAA